MRTTSVYRIPTALNINRHTVASRVTSRPPARLFPNRSRERNLSTRILDIIRANNAATLDFIQVNLGCETREDEHVVAIQLQALLQGGKIEESGKVSWIGERWVPHYKLAPKKPDPKQA